MRGLHYCQVPVHFLESIAVGLLCRPKIGPYQKAIGLESV